MSKVKVVIDLTFPYAKIDPRIRKSIKKHKKKSKFGRTKAIRKHHRGRFRYWRDIYRQHNIKALKLDVKTLLHRFSLEYKSHKELRNICREFLREERRRNRRPFIRVLTFV